VARYKLRVGKRISSATLIADARHSWLDALSSAGALAGLIAVAAGQTWGDPVAGLAVTAFICHVGYEVTKDVVHRLADGVDPEVISTAEAAAGSVPGGHPRARPGPLDRPHPARGSRGLGGSGAFRPGRRRAGPPGRWPDLAPAPPGKQPHLDDAAGASLIASSPRALTRR
jgi:Cation efflux family